VDVHEDRILCAVFLVEFDELQKRTVLLNSLPHAVNGGQPLIQV
jgi:hypothetical protein